MQVWRIDEKKNPVCYINITCFYIINIMDLAIPSLSYTNGNSVQEVQLLVIPFNFENLE